MSTRYGCRLLPRSLPWRANSSEPQEHDVPAAKIASGRHVEQSVELKSLKVQVYVRPRPEPVGPSPLSQASVRSLRPHERATPAARMIPTTEDRCPPRAAHHAVQRWRTGSNGRDFTLRTRNWTFLSVDLPGSSPPSDTETLQNPRPKAGDSVRSDPPPGSRSWPASTLQGVPTSPGARSVD